MFCVLIHIFQAVTDGKSLCLETEKESTVSGWLASAYVGGILKLEQGCILQELRILLEGAGRGL